jgi:5-oxoprolinase (ATP-hydrolysing)
MLRDGSGGVGQFNGGDGVVRRYRFTRPLTLSVLTERRSFSPYGMAGGGEGQRGRNTLIRKDGGREQNIGAKASIPVSAGDVFLLETPGGGGYGEPSREEAAPAPAGKRAGKGSAQSGTSGVASGGSLGEYAANQESA